MAAPDFLASRRQLRRARIQDALGLPHRNVNVRLHRNRLLERLAVAADAHAIEFDSLADSIVDTVVSLAIAQVEERTLDAVQVVLICVKVLAIDGQFARLKLLAPKIGNLAGRMSSERPFLGIALHSLSLVLQGDEDDARDNLIENLASSASMDVEPDDGRATLDDLLACAVLKRLLEDGDRDFTERARQVSLSRHAGLLHNYIDAVAAWHAAAARARPASVLKEADATFSKRRLANYLEQLRVSVLFPAQITAISAGATTEKDLVVSLPTSSGKTLLAEFRVVASLTRNLGSKAIYVAPYRLLARQVETSFRIGLRSLGMSVRDLSGGYDATATPDHDTDDVTVCTPERLDSLLRLASSNASGHETASAIFEKCSVLVFDELQLVGRDGRGVGMELLITRLRSRYPGIKLLGLAASSQNMEELSRWLTGDPPISGARRPTGTLEIVWERDGRLFQRVEPRPTQVEQLDRGGEAATDAARLISRLTIRNAPVLAIETTRQFAERLADKVAGVTVDTTDEWRESLSVAQVELLNNSVEEVRLILGHAHPLAALMERGIAFHHAGVPPHALHRIEALASARALRVVCATTTVAEGSDLPFRAVVIPHLNFPGTSRRLDRDLYLNIVGRAGRANVSVEGMVFLLNTDAPTLRGLIRDTLWSRDRGAQVRGRLDEIDPRQRSIEGLNQYLNLQSHVLAWLGEGDSYVSDQSRVLAERTLSWRTSNTRSRKHIVSVIDGVLEDLEQRGYALAASPYRLTTRGLWARLTGLNVRSVQRLETAVRLGANGWLAELAQSDELDEVFTNRISRMLFESVEMAAQSLWLRRSANTDEGRARHLLAFSEGAPVPAAVSDVLEAEITIFSSWIQGYPLIEIAKNAPRFGSSNSLFGGDDPAKRTSDVAQYIGGAAYYAGWVWSAVKLLWDSHSSVAMPSFIRDSVEFGVPSEGVIRLVTTAGLTRPAAMRISQEIGGGWNDLESWLGSDDFTYFRKEMTRLDSERLDRLRDRLA